MLNEWLQICIFECGYMAALFILGLIIQDNSKIDVAWGMGYVFIAIYSFIYFAVQDGRQIVLLVCICIWGLRLSLHILERGCGGPEDFRYAAWRRRWKCFHLRAFF